MGLLSRALEKGTTHSSGIPLSYGGQNRVESAYGEIEISHTVDSPAGAAQLTARYTLDELDEHIGQCRMARDAAARYLEIDAPVID